MFLAVLQLASPAITTRCALPKRTPSFTALSPLSSLPAIWTDYKKDELANIYKGKGTQKEKESVYEILFSINPSQNNSWEKIKE